MAKMKMQVPNFNALAKQLEDLGGDVKKATEDALKETHRIVTDKIEQAMVPSNMPAHGKYWTGRTLDNLRLVPNISWVRGGSVAYVPVGFDILNGGLTSIFLMYGTPRMKPVPGLYEAVFGNATQAEIIEAQTRILHEAIYEAMGGGE